MASRPDLRLVAVGGAAGATVRWAVAEAVGTGRLPWATLAVNVAGCALLGRGLARWGPSAHAALGVGFCGGLTTLSTLAVELDTMLAAGEPARALVYVTLSIVLGLGAFEAARATT